MGKPANLKNEVTEKPARKGQPARWPFDPMSDPLSDPPPEAVKRVQKQTGAGKRTRTRKAASR